MDVESDIIVQTQPTRSDTRTRVVRLFLSSTFLDMQAERDVLTKFVFPEIRKRADQRGVEFLTVDLRWGVTSDQVQAGQLLPICLPKSTAAIPIF